MSGVGLTWAICVREAGMLALRECREAQQVEWRHFTRAVDVVKPARHENIAFERQSNSR